MFCSKHFVKNYPKIENYFIFWREKMSKDKLSFATGGLRNVKSVQSLYCLTHHIVNDSIYVLFPKMYCQHILTKTCTWSAHSQC